MVFTPLTLLRALLILSALQAGTRNLSITLLRLSPQVVAMMGPSKLKYSCFYNGIERCDSLDSAHDDVAFCFFKTTAVHHLPRLSSLA
jgi:hypothetical protein